MTLLDRTLFKCPKDIKRTHLKKIKIRRFLSDTFRISGRFLRAHADGYFQLDTLK